MTPVLLKVLPKIAEEGTLPNSFCEATIPLKLKPDKATVTAKLPASVADEHRCSQAGFSWGRRGFTVHKAVSVTDRRDRRRR